MARYVGDYCCKYCKLNIGAVFIGKYVYIMYNAIVRLRKYLVVAFGKMFVYIK